jgi:hypothetical protein
MTVCIAAACDSGERIVTATDSLLNLGDVVGECVPAKMMWFGDWHFLFAGNPANFGMISEELSDISVSDPNALLRPRITKTVLEAYRKLRAQVSSFEVLSPFNVTMEEFKATGLECFGEEFHGDMLRRISQASLQFSEQLIMTGWGLSPYSATIYEIGPWGDMFHEASGFTAIGSGSQMAKTMLLLLGQARHRSLAETIFNVACAKFSSEKSADLDVGKMTSMFVSRKRTEQDDAKLPCGEFISPDDIQKLRSLWESHLKPRIPPQARMEITGIAARVNKGKVTLRDIAERINAMNRMASENVEVNLEDLPDPESSTPDQSTQPPLPESPGGSDES